MLMSLIPLAIMAAFGLCVAHAIVARGWSFKAGAALIFMVLLLGALSTAENYYADSKLDELMEGTTLAMRQEFQTEQDQRLWQPLRGAGIGAGVCVVPFFIGEVRRRRKRQDADHSR